MLLKYIIAKVVVVVEVIDTCVSSST